MGHRCAQRGTPAAMPSPTLLPGQAAPPFRLADEAGRIHDLAQYGGRWLVLYFYPKDDTPGCTREACGFRDAMAAMESLGARVLGVSLDSAERHAHFRKKYGLSFPLLSDPGGEVAGAYGSRFRLACLRLAKRHTFIIDPQGRIARIYRSVSPGTHSSEVIADLKRLRQAAKP